MEERSVSPRSEAREALTEDALRKAGLTGGSKCLRTPSNACYTRVSGRHSLLLGEAVYSLLAAAGELEEALVLSEGLAVGEGLREVLVERLGQEQRQHTADDAEHAQDEQRQRGVHRGLRRNPS